VESARIPKTTIELIDEHLGYARAIAAEMLKRYPPNVPRCDLERAAEWGLVQAAHSYDASRGTSFATYSYYRIRGAVYDELVRSRRWWSKREEAANDYMTDYTSARAHFEGAQGTYQELRKVAAHLMISCVLSVDTLSREPADEALESPIEHLLRKEQQETVHKALALLPNRNRIVLQSYYFEDLSFKEIGHRIGLSESRISRIHRKSLEMLHTIISELQSDGATTNSVARTTRKTGTSAQWRVAS